MAGHYKWILKNLANNEVFQLQEPHPDPEGWNEMTLKLYRSEQYHGIFLEPGTKQFGFYKDGGGQEFIEAIRATDDVNARIQLICLFRPHEGATYQQIFKHVLSMGSYSYENRLCYFSIDHSDIYSKLIARENIEVDLENTTAIGGETITAPATETVSLPGQTIKLMSEWKVSDNYASNDLFATGGNGTWLGYFTPLAEMGARDFQISQPLFGYSQWDPGNQVAYNNEDSSIAPMLTLANQGFNTPVTMNYDIKLSGEWRNWRVTSPTSRDLQIMKCLLVHGKRTDPTNTMSVITLYDYGVTVGAPETGDVGDGSTVGETFDIDTTGTFTLNTGDSVFLFWVVQFSNTTGSDTIGQVFNYDTGNYIKINADTQLEATDCKTMLVHEAFNQVVDAIVGSDGNFYSEFYGRTDSDKLTYGAEGEGAYKAITRGECIRLKDVPITTSFQKLFNSAHAIDNVGMCIDDDKVRVENFSFFYDSYNRILQLPNVRKIKTQISEKHYYNHIKIGYTRYESEISAGLDEPNTASTWSTTVANAQGKYEKLSEFIGSSYAIETTRRKNINQTTEDWRFDAENFWLCLNSDKTVELKADAFDSVSNMVAADTAYNLRITPARMLQAHFPNIVGALQTIGGAISFITKPGNRDLSSNMTETTTQASYSGNTLSESASPVYNDASVVNRVPAWTPLLDSFEYPLTFDQFITIRDNPYGYIEYYETEDDIRRGFLMECNFSILSGKTQFKILRRNVNTLS